MQLNYDGSFKLRTYDVCMTDFKRSLCSAGFASATVGTMLVLIIASLQPLLAALNSGPLPYGFHTRQVLSALRSEWMTMALPALSALPYTAAYVDDIKSGVIKQLLVRADRRGYIAGKILACAASGALALVTGVLLAWGIGAWALPPMELAADPGAMAEPLFAQILMQTALLGCSGALWALVGLALSAATLSKYIAYAAPFILYYVLIILHERYFEDFLVLYPKEWMNPSLNWPLGAWGIVALLAVLSAAFALVFALAAHRRLFHG